MNRKKSLNAFSAKYLSMGGTFGGPSVQKFNSDVEIYGIVSLAAMQDAGEHEVCHGKLCAR